MEQPASEYAQPGLDSPPSARPLPEPESEQQSAPSTDTTAAATAAPTTSATNGHYATPIQVDQKPPAPASYNGTTAPSTESRPVNGTSTPSAIEYTINTATAAAAAAAAAPQLSTPPATARTVTGGYTDYLARQPQYHPASQHPSTAASPGMAQATSPSPSANVNVNVPFMSTTPDSAAVATVREMQQQVGPPPIDGSSSRAESVQTPQSQAQSIPQAPQTYQDPQAHGQTQAPPPPQPPAPQPQPQPPQPEPQAQAQTQEQGPIKSDSELPVDPSMAPVATPAYPQYAPYPPQGHDMSHYAHPPPQIYGRPEWPPQYAQPAHHAIPAAYASPATTVGTSPQLAAAPPRPGQAHYFSQVYSFVPIPGTQQHKRPRRRYEEIERMYKCGWNGCEKAYGTLNHLNAHVTMQSHGAKRTPEEFKEIRKEWKARKKEEEAQRKAAEERERAAAAAQQASQQVDGVANGADASSQTQQATYSTAGRQLPPIGYQAADGQVPQPQYQTTPNGTILYQTGNGQVSAGYHPGSYPHSPYGQGQQVYQQPRE
ncbi:hypothetical protein KEM56_006015 [Ascosphaera pollenicola]|nr:hypothetical protein KEM56_006015 [Ascosphaera pollenicola]